RGPVRPLDARRTRPGRRAAPERRRARMAHQRHHTGRSRAAPPAGGRGGVGMLTRPKVTESAFQRQVLALAKMLGWRTAHFRPAMNQRGDWRTPVAGDGKGWPDLVLVKGERVLFRELKT